MSALFRNPDNDISPWCLIKNGDIEECDIPKCQQTVDTDPLPDPVNIFL